MEYLIVIGQVIGVFIAIIMISAILLYYANKWVEHFTKLKLYGYYTNGIYVWQLIQYDKIQATLYDIKEERMVIMGLHEFLRDFQFLMADTISSIEYTDEKKES